MIKPMKGNVCPPDKLPGYGWIAEEKFDGYRMIMTITNGIVRCFSYTGKEMTEKLPQFKYSFISDAPDAILDGELVPKSGVFKDLKSIIGAKAPKAIAWQKEHGYAKFNVFDMLSCGGDISNKPLTARKDHLWQYLGKWLNTSFIRPVFSYSLYGDEINNKYCWHKTIESFEELRDQMWANGKEGLMFKKFDGTYEQKRSKNILKLKESHTFDVVVMGFTEPTKDFEGKTDLSKWPYWEEIKGGKIILNNSDFNHDCDYSIPVTKSYAMGWPGAVEFGVYKPIYEPTISVFPLEIRLVKVGECRGFTDEDLEYIKNNKDKLLGKVIEVKAQRLEDPLLGTLRHPQFNRWRDDKPAEECTWESHINAGK